MLAQLRAAGTQVDDRIEDYDYGRFGWATDTGKRAAPHHRLQPTGAA